MNYYRSTSSRIALAAAVGCVAAPLAAQAQSGENQPVAIEQIVVTATRTERKLIDVPATVSVITAVEIEDRLVTDIKELIAFEPGISVRAQPARFNAALSATGRDGNSGFNVRGLEGNRVLIQTDGIRVPDGFSFGAQSVGRGDYVDLGLVKSVEFLRGPASALYGSDGVAGAVSFTTKDPEDYLTNGRSWHVRGGFAYADSDNSTSESAIAAGKSGAWQAMAAYTRRDFEGTETKGTNTSANTDRTVPNPTDGYSNAVLAKVVFADGGPNRFRLTYDHNDRKVKTNVLSAIAKPPLGSTSTLALEARDTSKRNRVSFDHRYTGDDGDLIERANWAVFYQDSKTVEYTAEDRNTAADRTRLNTFDNRIIGGNAELHSGFDTGAVSHELVYGGDLSVTRQEGLRDGTIPPAGEVFPTRAFPNTDYTQLGLFLMDEIKFLDGQLTVSPALRFDYYKLSPKADALFTALVPKGQSDEHLSPKIGVVYKFTPAVGAFANYAKGFKAPSPSQINNGFTNTIQNYISLPNTDLKPETSDAFEGGLRYIDPTVSASVSAFTSKYKDFIEGPIVIAGNFTPTNPAQYKYLNLGRVKISGIEGQGRVNFTQTVGAQFSAGYSKGTARSAAGGAKFPLNSVDPVKLVGGLTYRDTEDRFGGQFTVTHSAGKKDSRVDQSVCTPVCFTPSGFTIADLTAYANLTEYATVRVGVFNLFDKKHWWWADVRGLSDSSLVKDVYTQPGRNVSGSLTVKF